MQGDAPWSRWTCHRVTALPLHWQRPCTSCVISVTWKSSLRQKRDYGIYRPQSAWVQTAASCDKRKQITFRLCCQQTHPGQRGGICAAARCWVG